MNLRHPMRGLLLICMLPLLASGFQDSMSVHSSPPWSRYSEFPEVDGIMFRWRVEEGINPRGERFFEFEFRNRSDTLKSFNYVIEAGSDQQIVGSITLPGRRSRLSGWYFKAAAIRKVDVITPESLKLLLERQGE